jgi:hypothetical protein
VEKTIKYNCISAARNSGEFIFIKPSKIGQFGESELFRHLVLGPIRQPCFRHKTANPKEYLNK